MRRNFIYQMPELRKQISFIVEGNLVYEDRINKAFGNVYEAYLRTIHYPAMFNISNADKDVPLPNDVLSGDDIFDIGLYMTNRFAMYYITITNCKVTELDITNEALNCFIGRLNLPTVVKSAAYRNGIFSIKDFVDYSREDLLHLPHFGEGCYSKIIDEMDRIGIQEKPNGHMYIIPNSRIKTLYSNLINHISELSSTAVDFVLTMHSIGFAKDELRVEYEECGYEEEFDEVWAIAMQSIS